MTVDDSKKAVAIAERLAENNYKISSLAYHAADVWMNHQGYLHWNRSGWWFQVIVVIVVYDTFI